MEVVKANNENLASVLMGKNIMLPWRGQKDVVISVPYSEWLKFIRGYGSYLRHRGPLDYRKAAQFGNTDMSIRYFLYDISWAQYSELACSQNMAADATLILPYFDDGRWIQIDEVYASLEEINLQEVQKYHNRLRAVTRGYYNLIGGTDLALGLVDLSNLSAWNAFVFQVCMYLQSRSSNQIKTEKLNIDWRSI